MTKSSKKAHSISLKAERAGSQSGVDDLANLVFGWFEIDHSLRDTDAFKQWVSAVGDLGRAEAIKSEIECELTLRIEQIKQQIYALDCALNIPELRKRKSEALTHVSRLSKEKKAPLRDKYGAVLNLSVYPFNL